MHWLFNIVNEAFGAAKEVKVGGLEKVYTNRFSHPAKKLAKYTAAVGLVRQLPRYFLEIIIFGGMLILILYFLRQTGSFSNAAPIVALYAYAGYRLMPALQQLYASITSIRFGSPAIYSLSNDFENLQTNNANKTVNNLLFQKSISLKNVNYRYPNSERPVLNNLNFKITANSTLGIVGSTGCGKTTTIDNHFRTTGTSTR